ncbi:MAG: tetratricopeptide repeat protein [Lacipirellulaceae bacterium]
MRLFIRKNQAVVLAAGFRGAGLAFTGGALLAATTVAQAQQGAVYIEDFEAIERASVELPTLGGAPLPQRPAISPSQPTGRAPQGHDPYAAARATAEASQPPKRPTLLQRLGFGGMPEAEAIADDASPMQSRPSFAQSPYVQPQVSQPQPGQPVRTLGVVPSNGGVGQVGFNAATAGRSSGIQMRSGDGPKRGLLSKLGLFASEDERRATDRPPTPTRVADGDTRYRGAARLAPRTPQPGAIAAKPRGVSAKPQGLAVKPGAMRPSSTPLAATPLPKPAALRPFQPSTPSFTPAPLASTPSAKRPSIVASASPERPIPSIVSEPSGGVVMVSDATTGSSISLKPSQLTLAAKKSATRKTTPVVSNAAMETQTPIATVVAKPSPIGALPAAPAPTPGAIESVAPQAQGPVSKPLVVSNPAALAPVAAESRPNVAAAPTVVAPTPLVYPSAMVARSTPSAVRPTTPAPVARQDDHRQPSDRARALLAESHALAESASTIEDFSAIVQRCRYVLAIDDTAQAVAYANQLAGWGLNKRGEALLDAGAIDEATIDFQEALAADANCWRAEHNLGVLEAQNGERDAARVRFNRTLELNPEFAKAYSNRAALAVQQGDYDAALDDYARAIAADPDLAVAHTGRGRVCHLMGRVDEAQRHLDAAQVLSPGDASIAVAQGDLLVDLGRFTQAYAAYTRAIELDSTRSTPYRNLSWLLATCPIDSVRNGQGALDAATKAEELAGGADDILLDTKAAALAAVGRFDEAAVLAQQAIDAAPAGEEGPYRERLVMYQAGTPYVTPSSSTIQQAAYTGAPTPR